jgi:hypothetical protein
MLEMMIYVRETRRKTKLQAMITTAIQDPNRTSSTKEKSRNSQTTSSIQTERI